MSRRPLILAALTFVSVACTNLPDATVNYGSGLRFVPAVADANDNVGLGSSVAVGADGMPFVSYFGFPKEVAEDEVVVPRPIGTPSVPGVLLTSLTSDQVFDRGAVVMAEAAPTGVSIAFGPQVPEDLDLTETNTNGTATVVGEDGTVHVVYTASDGVWYARTSLGGTTTLEQVYDHPITVNVAGPMGRPGVALVDGVPVVAYAVDTLFGVEVRVASPVEDGWIEEVVATTGRCNGCPQPGPTGIVAADGDPVVGSIDPATGELVLATRVGDVWVEERTAGGVGARGLSLAVVDGSPVAALYADGGVRLFSGGLMSEVASADVADLPETGDAAPTTAVAAGADGALYVAWQDPAGVHLASGEPGALEPVETQATGGGRGPALAVNAEGSVFLVWYSSRGQDLYLGALTENPDILVANPSPSVVVSLGPPLEPCDENSDIQLSIVAVNTSFDPTCLVAPAGEDFLIDFDNQDAGVPHDIAIYTDVSRDEELFNGEDTTGPQTIEYPVPAIDEGEYFFLCTFHPTVMTGTLVATAGDGDGGGGGGGGNGNGGGGG